MDARKGKSEAQVAPVVPVVPSHYYAPNYAYAPTYTYAATATPVSPNPSSQFHAQDNFGNYNYGYADPNSAKQEIKAPDGTVQGSYSYVDANGVVQTVNYIADDHGFRVAATNLPQGPAPAPAVAPAPQVYAAPLTPVHNIIASSPYLYGNSYANAAPVYASIYVYAAPVTPVSTPVVAAAPAAPAAPVTSVQSSQFHSQDDLG